MEVTGGSVLLPFGDAPTSSQVFLRSAESETDFIMLVGILMPTGSFSGGWIAKQSRCPQRQVEEGRGCVDGKDGHR